MCVLGKERLYVLEIWETNASKGAISSEEMKISESSLEGHQEFNCVKFGLVCIMQKVFDSNHLRFLPSSIFTQLKKAHLRFVRGQRSERIIVALYPKNV